MKSEKVRTKKLRSLSSSIWLNFTLFAVIIVILIGIVSAIIVSTSTDNRSKNMLRDVGNEVVDTLVEFTEEFYGDTEGLMSTVGVYLGGVEATEFVRIYIFNGETGALEYPGRGNYSDFSDYIDAETAEEMLNKARSEYEDRGSDSYVVYSGEDDRLTYVYMLSNGTESRYFVMQASMRATNTIANYVIVYIVIMCVLAIVAALIISYFLSEHLSGPIKDITQSATELGKGNYDVRFTAAEYTEVAQLSDTLNRVTGEIKKSDDFQRQLLANVSHDLKTPLTMIKAYASMIKEISGDDPEKRNKHLDVIIDETDRLTGMINDVLQVSKAGSDTKLNRKVFNITEFLFSIIDKFGYLQDTDGYKIMVDVDPDLYTLADEEKIGQVIYNLISNAVNYTGADKTVYVSLKENMEEKRIFFAVRDTGKGIEPEDMEHIWDRYYRKQENHVRSVKGTGLGLNIVKIILQNHKFLFGVDSEPGVGSTFWVEFPSVPETYEAEEGEEDAE
ncbi:MAG: HAMP domain-containing histidine kinase [Clostridia bacterium]|nr:HAMP domain-containing histidine kinase [Clostridia bacterium]